MLLASEVMARRGRERKGHTSPGYRKEGTKIERVQGEWGPSTRRGVLIGLGEERVLWVVSSFFFFF